MRQKITDKLPFVPAQEAVRSAFLVLQGIQSQRPENQVAGIAMAFSTMCRALELDPSQLIDAAYRRSADDDTFFKRELKALTDYFQGEVK